MLLRSYAADGDLERASEALGHMRSAGATPSPAPSPRDVEAFPQIEPETRKAVNAPIRCLDILALCVALVSVGSGPPEPYTLRGIAQASRPRA